MILIIIGIGIVLFEYFRKRKEIVKGGYMSFYEAGMSGFYLKLLFGDDISDDDYVEDALMNLDDDEYIAPQIRLINFPNAPENVDSTVITIIDIALNMMLFNINEVPNENIIKVKYGDNDMITNFLVDYRREYIQSKLCTQNILNGERETEYKKQIICIAIRIMRKLGCSDEDIKNYVETCVNTITNKYYYNLPILLLLGDLYMYNFNSAMVNYYKLMDFDYNSSTIFDIDLFDIIDRIYTAAKHDERTKIIISDKCETRHNDNDDVYIKDVFKDKHDRQQDINLVAENIDKINDGIPFDALQINPFENQTVLSNDVLHKIIVGGIYCTDEFSTLYALYKHNMFENIKIPVVPSTKLLRENNLLTNTDRKKYVTNIVEHLNPNLLRNSLSFLHRYQSNNPVITYTKSVVGYTGNEHITALLNNKLDQGYEYIPLVELSSGSDTSISNKLCLSDSLFEQLLTDKHSIIETRGNKKYIELVQLYMYCYDKMIDILGYPSVKNVTVKGIVSNDKKHVLEYAFTTEEVPVPLVQYQIYKNEADMENNINNMTKNQNLIETQTSCNFQGSALDIRTAWYTNTKNATYKTTIKLFLYSYHFLNRRIDLRALTTSYEGIIKDRNNIFDVSDVFPNAFVISEIWLMNSDVSIPLQPVEFEHNCAIITDWRQLFIICFSLFNIVVNTSQEHAYNCKLSDTFIGSIDDIEYFDICSDVSHLSSITISSKRSIAEIFHAPYVGEDGKLSVILYDDINEQLNPDTNLQHPSMRNPDEVEGESDFSVVNLGFDAFFE